MVYLSSHQVQARYQISRSSLYRWMEDAEIRFPKPLKIGHRVLWCSEDLSAFDSRLRQAAGNTQTITMPSMPSVTGAGQ